MITEPVYTQQNPKPLRTEFIREGMTHRQIKREGNIAIFQIGLVEPGFEVIVIRVAKPQKLPGGEMAGWREVYPSTSEFGVKGWYFAPRLAAETKFAWLVARHESK